MIETQNSLLDKSVELETISENIAGGVLITTLEQGFPAVRANRGFYDMTGCKPEELIGKNAIEWIASEDINITQELICDQLNKVDYVEFEHRIQNKLEEKLWISLRGKRAKINNLEVVVWMLADVTNLKLAEESAKISEELYRIASQNTADIIIDYNISTGHAQFTSKATEIYDIIQHVKYSPNELVEKQMIAKTSSDSFLRLFKALDRGEEKIRSEIMTVTTSGRQLWNRISFTTLFSAEHIPVRAVGVLEDITREKEAERKYQMDICYRDITLKDSMLNYEIDINKGRFLRGHEGIVQMFSGVLTNNYNEVMKLMIENIVYEEDRELVAFESDLEIIKNEYETENRTKRIIEYRRIMPNGEIVWVQCTMHVFEDKEIDGLMGLCVIKDINEAKLKEIALCRKAERDLLTGLYNKVTTESMIHDFLENPENDQEENKGAFFVIDLDDFKKINDTLGHAFGDAVLSEVARKISTMISKENIVGRIGGDEFAVFIKNTGDRQKIEEQARSMCEMFHSTYTGTDNDYKVSGTIGIAFAPEHGTTFKSLYEKADVALYYAKNAGKDTFEIYSRGMEMDKANSGAKKKDIDENAGKTFSGNITEYLLRIMYESNDPRRAVRAILQLLTQHFNYSRGYIFELSRDELFWRNSFEWCAENIQPEIQNLQHLPCDAIQSYDQCFDDDGIFILTSLNNASQQARDILEPQGIKSMVQCAIVENGVLKGYVGLDECTREREPSEDEIASLKLVSMFVATFLLNGRTEEEDLYITEEIEDVMNTVDNFIYMIDAETYEIRYMNAKTCEIVPQAKLGDICYKVLRGKNEPCSDCPMKLITNKAIARTKIYNDVLDVLVDVTVSRVMLRDGNLCGLLNCMDITE